MRAPSGGDLAAAGVLLSIENVSLAFGGVRAISDVSFDIRKGEIRAIIGPNGAGKTSMLNVINGFYQPQDGRITFKGATRSKMRDVTVAHDASSDISRHWIAINMFLETNDPSHLAAFVGKGVRDSDGAFHPFETRPNVLRKLDSVGELSFVDIYRQTVQ